MPFQQYLHYYPYHYCTPHNAVYYSHAFHIISFIYTLVERQGNSPCVGSGLSHGGECDVPLLRAYYACLILSSLTLLYIITQLYLSYRTNSERTPNELHTYLLIPISLLHTTMLQRIPTNTTSRLRLIISTQRTTNRRTTISIHLLDLTLQTILHYDFSCHTCQFHFLLLTLSALSLLKSTVQRYDKILTRQNSVE